MIFRSTFPFISPSSTNAVLEFRRGEETETRSSETSSDEVDGNNPLFKVSNSLVTRDREDLISFVASRPLTRGLRGAATKLGEHLNPLETDKFYLAYSKSFNNI